VLVRCPAGPPGYHWAQPTWSLEQVPDLDLVAHWSRTGPEGPLVFFYRKHHPFRVPLTSSVHLAASAALGTVIPARWACSMSAALKALAGPAAAPWPFRTGVECCACRSDRIGVPRPPFREAARRWAQAEKSDRQALVAWVVPKDTAQRCPVFRVLRRIPALPIPPLPTGAGDRAAPLTDRRRMEANPNHTPP